MLLNILQVPAIIIYVCAFARTAQWIICKIFKKVNPRKFKIFQIGNKSLLYQIAVIVLLAINIFTFLYSSNNHIPDGVHCFKVSAVSSSGEYVLPAEIHVRSDISFGHQHINQRFYLDSFYWPNGGYCFFSNRPYLSFDNYIKHKAQDGRTYMVKLTKEQSYHDSINEMSYEQNNTLNTAYTLFFVFGILMSSVYFFKDNVLDYSP